MNYVLRLTFLLAFIKINVHVLAVLHDVQLTVNIHEQLI